MAATTSDESNATLAVRRVIMIPSDRNGAVFLRRRGIASHVKSRAASERKTS
jgi:hypothetical protein